MKLKNYSVAGTLHHICSILEHRVLSFFVSSCCLRLWNNGIFISKICDSNQLLPLTAIRQTADKEPKEIKFDKKYVQFQPCQYVL